VVLDGLILYGFVILLLQVACAGDRWVKMACARTCWLNACRKNNAASWAAVPFPRPGARLTWTLGRCFSGASWVTEYHAQSAKVIYS